TTIDKCYKIITGGTYTFPGFVNIIENRTNRTQGGIYIVDKGQVVDLRFPAMLSEKGGTLQAGSACDPFGKMGGKLTIGIFGTDPSDEGRVPSPSPGIKCKTAPNSQPYPCFPATPAFAPDKYSCTQATDDPCGSTAPPPTPTGTPIKWPYPPSNNYLSEEYRNLNFDPTSFGYKVLGVSYGGALNLFGYNSAAA